MGLIRVHLRKSAALTYHLYHLRPSREERFRQQQQQRDQQERPPDSLAAFDLFASQVSICFSTFRTASAAGHADDEFIEVQLREITFSAVRVDRRKPGRSAVTQTIKSRSEERRVGK